MLKKLLITLLIFTTIGINSVFADEYNADIYEDENPIRTTRVQKPSQVVRKSYPKIEGQILAEFIIDSLDSSKGKINPKDDRVDYRLFSIADFKLKFTNEFFVGTKWYLRPVNKRVYDGQIYAENPGYIVDQRSDYYGKENYIRRRFQGSSYGLGVEELYAGYRNKNLQVLLGKFDPTFGSAFDRSRFHGIYGVVKPLEYKLIEKIGGSVAALLPFGDFTLNLFFDDTSGLSNTAFKQRGQDKSEGKAGNTEKLNNFSFTFDTKRDNLSFNIGLRILETTLSYEKKETGFVTGLEYLVDLNYDVKFLPFVEFVYLNNFDGAKDRDMYYFTAFLPFIYENWHIIFSTTTRFDDEKGYKDYFSYINQISFGYKFDNGIMLDAAKIWEKYADKADDFSTVGKKRKFTGHQDSWAFMISYVFKF